MEHSLEIELSHCADLPSLPGVALRILALARDPEVALEAVAEVVSLDPAMSAKILRIANSALYARQRRCHSLRQALTLLGLNAVLMLALTFCLVRTFRRHGRQGLDYTLFWRRALLGALASRAVGEWLDLGRGEELFLAGLLQDIGMLALDRALPARYRPVCARQPPHEHLLATEREHLGTDHAEVGAWLLRRWHLPEPLPQAVALSHTLQASAADPDTRAFLHCVAVSGPLADVLLGDDRVQGIDQVAAITAQRLGLDPNALAQVLNILLAHVPEVNALFEVPLVSTTRAEALLSQARELLLVRALHGLQEATEVRRTADTLEARTRELEERLRRDPLTGLYNRAHLERVLQEELARARQHGWPISVLFLDLDRFKQLNDTYGHLAGDLVLATVARLLTQYSRSTDLVARYGGEEFVVVLPGTGAASARVVGERIVQSLAATPCDIGQGQRVGLTLSAGMVSHGEGIACERADDLLASADRAMYAAKRRGGNQAVMFDPRTMAAPPGMHAA